jgi:Ca-activated chloride channel family protein
MKFGSPDMFWVLALGPALILFFAFSFKAKGRALESFAASAVLVKLLEGVSFPKQRAKAALLVLVVALVALSLLKPQWGYHSEKVERKGVDIMVALDTSRSMLAGDVQPNRLECAKRKIKDLLSVLRGDRIGLTIFAGDAFVQCPLTLDYAAFNIFLDDASVGSVPLGGTAIGRAIRKSLSGFEGKGKKHKVLILITDGEDHEGDALAAAQEAKQSGVPIYTIGIGRKSGDYIWVTNEKGERERLKDSQGNYVKSHLDEVTLNKIALETGGRYSPADSGDWGLERIYRDEIAAMEKRLLGSQQVRHYEHRFQWPLMIGIVLLLTEGLMDEKKRNQKTPVASE